MSASDLERLATGTAPRKTGQGPTPEEWENVKDEIKTIYIDDENSLEFLMQKMREKGFGATRKMYTNQFTIWSPEFNKNRNSAGTRPVPSSNGKRIRPRRYGGQVQSRSHLRNLRPHPSTDIQLSDGYTRHRAFLNSIEVYVYGLFDSSSLSADMFDIIVPAGSTDQSLAWQLIGDEFFGFTTLLERNQHAEAWQTYSIIGDRLDAIVGCENDYAMIIKLWPICIRLINASILYRSDWILSGFLNYLRRLSMERYKQGTQDHPIPKLLTFLCQIPIGELLNVVQMGYLRTVHCLENRLAFGNALVLSTWSNYMKKCEHQALPADILISRYSTVLQAAKDSFTPTGTRTIEILHDYIYAAYYNAGDHQLTWNLALETINLARTPGLMGEQPTWCLAIQGYALAVKLMYILSPVMGLRDLAVAEMELAIERLGRGDRECHTRAVMLTGLLDRN
ncbi:hypothetical protein FLAG1_10006 [Fusarium langsethiae]|uniref:Clr5 domain-containing protein n=1 Tax=Fusarium langsethiae TaxID=179993 RepID=A0A0M9EPF0_FUSLA|nr:hypothetical protein FLAG1_10006 [Fusarium langsethiae]GKU07240.1 unnamed protein product [Fusarium langsethiae]